MNTQNRLYLTLSPRVRKALDLCATLDGSSPASYGATLLWSALSREIEGSSALYERWKVMERKALEEGSWENVPVSATYVSDEPFTMRANKALAVARDEAVRFNHTDVSTEHLLLGLIYDNEAEAAQLLQNSSIKLSTVRSQVESLLVPNSQRTVKEIELTPQLQKVITLARNEARSRACHAVGTEHLLLGLVLESESIAAHLLADIGITSMVVHTGMLSILH